MHGKYVGEIYMVDVLLNVSDLYMHKDYIVLAGIYYSRQTSFTKLDRNIFLR